MKTRLILLPIIWLLVTAYSAEAQKRSIVSDLNTFLKKYPRTKVNLFVSQTKATPGDTIRLHAQVYDQSGSAFTQRQVLNIELADHNGRIVHRQNILMAAGSADSYLALPASLSEGFYLLRAYTNRMRNFGEDSFTWQSIEVVRERSLQRAASAPFISIHPEGGHLIGEVKNHVAVTYHGVPLGGSIRIIGSVSGELGVVFATASGISSLMIIPKADEVIYATNADELKSKAIKAASTGVAMLLREKQLNLRLTFPSRNFSNRDLDVILLGRGEARELQLRKDYADSLIYDFPANPANGYYQILVFSQDRRIIAQRIWGVTSDQPKLLLNLKNPEPGLREKSELMLQLRDDNNRPLKGNFNLTITDERGFQEGRTDDLISLLQRYQGVDPHEHQRRSNQNDLESIILQEQWLPDNWNDPAYNPLHQPQSTLRFSGEISRRDGLLFRDSTSVMLFLQKKMMGYEAPVKDGRFDAPVYFDFTGEDKLFFAVHRNDSALNDVVLRLDRDTLSARRAPEFKSLLSRDPFADFMSKKKSTDRSYRFFRSANTVTTTEQPDPNRLYEEALQGADVSVQIDDYVVFPTLDDVIREIVPSLKHRKAGGRSSVRVFLYSPVVTNTPILSFDEPLYIIDGHLTKSTEYFMNMNPADLISIRIVRNVQKLARFGYLGRNGVVLVKTRNPSAILQFKENLVTNVSGLNLPINNPRTISTDPRVPDLRIMLDWQTGRHTDDQGNFTHSFFTGDLAGSFLIRVEGITEDGTPFFVQQKFQVKEK